MEVRVTEVYKWNLQEKLNEIGYENVLNIFPSESSISTHYFIIHRSEVTDNE